MRKTIDFTNKEIEKIIEYQKRNSLKNFSAAVKNMIEKKHKCSCKSEDISDKKFVLLSKAIIELDKKIEIILRSIAPKSAGEVK